MTGIDYPTTCPFCRSHHDTIASMRGDGIPSDGSVTLCITCGELCVFDDSAKGGLRKPTKKEHRRIMRDDVTRQMVEAWKIVRQRKLKP